MDDLFCLGLVYLFVEFLMLLTGSDWLNEDARLSNRGWFVWCMFAAIIYSWI